MNKIITLVVLPFIVCQSNLALANGGPVAWTQLSPSSNLSVKPEQNDSITLLKENLKFTIVDLNRYRVKADYFLKNGGNPQKILFGLPITGDVQPDDEFGGEERAVYSIIEECKEEQLSRSNSWSPEECKQFVEENKEQLIKHAATVSKEIANITARIVLTFNDKQIECRHTNSAPFKDFRSPREYTLLNKTKAWCVTDELTFNGNSENHISMEYEADFDYEDSEFSKSPLTEFSDRKLQYYFSPAGYWKGNVSEVNIAIDLGPFEGFTTVKHPDNYKIEGQTIKWSLSDVDFKTEQKLEVDFSSNVLRKNQLGSWNISAPKYVKIKLAAQASSTLKDFKDISYSPQNATDGNRETAWCEGAHGSGEGEWIKFNLASKKFEDYCSLKGVAITPGYAKSQSTYSQNGRVKKIKISECSSDKGYVFDIPLSKNFVTSPFLIENSMPPGAWDKFITEYQNKHGNNYTHPDYLPPSEILDFINEQGCFKVEIMEVEKGKYDDSCISEISVVMNCG